MPINLKGRNETKVSLRPLMKRLGFTARSTIVLTVTALRGFVNNVNIVLFDIFLVATFC